MTNDRIGNNFKRLGIYDDLFLQYRHLFDYKTYVVLIHNIAGMSIEVDFSGTIDTCIYDKLKKKKNE